MPSKRPHCPMWKFQSLHSIKLSQSTSTSPTSCFPQLESASAATGPRVSNTKVIFSPWIGVNLFLESKEGFRRGLQIMIRAQQAEIIAPLGFSSQVIQVVRCRHEEKRKVSLRCLQNQSPLLLPTCRKGAACFTWLCLINPHNTPK